MPLGAGGTEVEARLTLGGGQGAEGGVQLGSRREGRKGSTILPPDRRLGREEWREESILQSAGRRKEAREYGSVQFQGRRREGREDSSFQPRGRRMVRRERKEDRDGKGGRGGG